MPTKKVLFVSHMFPVIQDAGGVTTPLGRTIHYNTVRLFRFVLLGGVQKGQATFSGTQDYLGP